MVYFLGGSSHCGKTLLAQRLLEAYHIPWVSLDHLKMGFIRSGMTDLTPEDDDALREMMWPFVAGLVRTVLENGQTLLLEGCYIPEGWQESFTPAELAQIRAVFLVMGEDYLRAHFDLVRDMANAAEQRIDDRPDLERLVRCSAWFRARCLAEGTPLIDIRDTFDPEALTAEAARLLGLGEARHG